MSEHARGGASPDSQQPRALVFDLDGVLTDTAELHYHSWVTVADEIGVPFDRGVNDRLRGLSRPESLDVLLGDRADAFSPTEKARLTEQKNTAYLQMVARMTPDDLFPGVQTLLCCARERAFRLAVASSSRNAGRVAERLGIVPLLDALVDANTAPRSKPDPQVFVEAAEALGVPPARCVVVEDAQVGVAAARAAGMFCVGVGPLDRIGDADLIVAHTADIDIAAVERLLDG